jgi:hypothetical protein
MAAQLENNMHKVLSYCAVKSIPAKSVVLTGPLASNEKFQTILAKGVNDFSGSHNFVAATQ